METDEQGYRSGITKPKFDKKIQELIQENNIELGDDSWVVAIHNNEKKVYRILKLYDFKDYIKVIDLLMSLGLNDTLEKYDSQKNGYDSFFNIPKDLDIE